MRLKEGFRLRPLGREFILTAEDTRLVNFNRMIALNASAAFLWRSAAGKDFTSADLADMLVNEYGIDMDRALADSEAIVAKWSESGLIQQ